MREGSQLFSLAQLTAHQVDRSEKPEAVDDSGLIDLRGMAGAHRPPSPSAPALTLGVLPLGAPEAAVEEPSGSPVDAARGASPMWIAVGMIGAGALVAAAIVVSRRPAPSAAVRPAPVAASPTPRATADRAPSTVKEPTQEPAPSRSVETLAAASAAPVASEEAVDEPPGVPPSGASQRPRQRAPRPAPRAAPKPATEKPAARPTHKPALPPAKAACPCAPSDLLCVMKCATNER